jgi:hypothetical protein
MSDRGQMRLIDLETPDHARRVVFEAPKRGLIWTFKFDRAGEHLLVGSYASGTWLVPLRQDRPKPLEGAPDFTSAVAFSRTGTRLVVGGGWHKIPEV